MHSELVASPRARTSVRREKVVDAAERARRLVLRDMPSWRLEIAQGRGNGGRAHPCGITASTSAVLWSLERDHDVQFERRDVPHRCCCWRRRDELEEKDEKENDDIDECPQDHRDERRKGVK